MDTILLNNSLEDKTMLFAAIDINGYSVQFEAWSWEVAEVIARRNKYKLIGKLVMEIDE